MNSDKCRTHRPVQRTSAFFWGDNVLRDFQSGCTGGSETADGRASGRRSTGRKEKRHQDNGRKPKCAKFHHNHSCRCERKAIKGCTVRIVSDHSAFRKRKSDRRCIYLCAGDIRKCACILLRAPSLHLVCVCLSNSWLSIRTL